MRTMQNIHKGARYFFVVPSNICLGFNLHTITSQLKPFCSPVRLSPAIGVMSGAHYQSSIQELLHLVATFAKCWTYYSSRAIFSKSLNTLHSIISISLSNKLEWMLMIEWDRLYLSFLKILLASLAHVHFLSYLCSGFWKTKICISTN